MKEVEKLIFVYNTEGSPLKRWKAWVQAIASPRTHPCRLYAVTHDWVGMHAEWKAFVSGLPYPTQFLFKDRFEQKYGQPESPALYAIHKGKLEPLITGPEIARCESLKDLQGLIIGKLLH